MKRRPTIHALATVLSLVFARDARAQLHGLYVPGFTGLQNGTQAPPSIIFALPVYFYSTDDLRNDAGQSINVHARINTTFVGPTIAWVTNVKLLDGNSVAR